MRIVKVRRMKHTENEFLDVARIVAISEPYELSQSGKTVSYYDIYFENTLWIVEVDSYEDTMRAWLNPEKGCVPQDLVSLIRCKQLY